jgi:hypothetical protein
MKKKSPLQVGRLESIVYAYENEHISIYDVDEMLEHFDIKWLEFLDSIIYDDVLAHQYTDAIDYYHELKEAED